jgi:hypothetical protein
MFDRLKRSLVDSYVGAIALGWIFADGILGVCNIFVAPVTGWIHRSEYRHFTNPSSGSSGILLQDALPDLLRSFLILLVGYLLLRWLYFKPSDNRGAVKSVTDPEQLA